MQIFFSSYFHPSKGGGFELPCSILFGFSHIDEIRGLKRVYETVFGLCFGEKQGIKGIERHEWT